LSADSSAIAKRGNVRNGQLYMRVRREKKKSHVEKDDTSSPCLVQVADEEVSASAHNLLDRKGKEKEREK